MLHVKSIIHASPATPTTIQVVTWAMSCSTWLTFPHAPSESVTDGLNTNPARAKRDIAKLLSRPLGGGSNFRLSIQNRRERPR